MNRISHIQNHSATSAVRRRSAYDEAFAALAQRIIRDYKGDTIAFYRNELPRRSVQKAK